MKKNIIKIVILLVLFLAVVSAGLYVALHREQDSVKYISMQERTLPQIMLEQEAMNQGFSETVQTGLLLNGYTSELEPIYASNTILPVGKDGELVLCILPATEDITGCSYAVRSLDSLALIEETTVSIGDCEQKDDTLVTRLQLTNLLENETEYYLIVTLSTTGHENICYYTRIYVGDMEDIGELAAFSERFSEATFDKETAKELLPIYIQTDDSMENDDFGYVNLHSSYRMLTWGDMEVSVVPGTRKVTFYEICPSQITIGMSYQVTVSGEAQPYSVEEHYCVRKRNERFYLLDYDRSMNQVYSYKEEVEGGTIFLGIRSFAPEEYMTSQNGKKAAFVADGTLYCYSSESNEMIKIFGFEETNSSGEQPAGVYEHDIRIVNVTDEGCVQFLVYGYMLRGSHEGENGIAFYEYNPEKNGAVEQFYITSKLPYDVMREGVGTTAFVNEANLCYLIYGSGIYAIVLEDGEFYSVTEHLQHGNFGISSRQDYVAWGNSTEEEGGCASVITVMSMENGHSIDITVEKAVLQTEEEGTDCYLLGLGFINDDFVYGIGRYEDIYYENGMNMVCPMFGLYIVDSETGETVGAYRKEGVYITGSEPGEERMILHRVARKTSGSETGEDLLGESGWETIEDDLLMVNSSNEQTVGQEFIQVKKRTSEGKLLEYALFLTASSEKEKVYSVHDSLYGEQQAYHLTLEHVDYSGDWRVYGRGELLEITGTLAEGIAVARECAGFVRGRNGNVYWALTPKELSQAYNGEVYGDESASSLANALALLTRGRKSPAEYETALQNRQVDELLQEEGYEVLTLYGCQVSDLTYYLNEGSCIIALLEEQEAVIISGYTSDGSIQVTDPVTGEHTLMTANEAGTYFDGYKNMFLTIG